MVRIGNKPQLMNSSLFRRLTQCPVAFVNVFLPHRSQCLTRAAELVISPWCTAWQRSESKLRAEKRRSQDLMSGRITASPSISCMVTSGPIVYPVMEDQFQLVNRVDVS